MKFPVYYPKLLTSGGQYLTPERDARGQLQYPRAYRIKAPDGKMKAAYRLVVSYGEDGNYYGIQGTTWTDPPILRNPSSDTRTINGKRPAAVLRRQAPAHRRLEDLARRLLGRRTRCRRDSRNDQMLAIAGSLTRLGGR